MKFGFYFEFQIVICWTFFPNRTDLFLMHYSFIVSSDDLSLAPTNYSSRLKILITSYLSSVQFMFTLCVSLKICPVVEHRSPVTTLIDVPDILYKCDFADVPCHQMISILIFGFEQWSSILAQHLHLMGVISPKLYQLVTQLVIDTLPYQPSTSTACVLVFLHHNALHYITSHHITLHYITLHYTTYIGT